MPLNTSKAKRKLVEVPITLTLQVYETETLERMVNASREQSGDDSNDTDFVVSDLVQERIAEFEAEEVKKEKEKERLAREAKEKEERERAPQSMPTERGRRGERAA